MVFNSAAVSAATSRIRVRGIAMLSAADMVRRVRDVVGSVVLLMVTLPLIALTACLIRLDSAGPVFYRQDRVGLHRRTFKLLKFRSMRTDAEATGPRWAAQRDPRLTRVGAVIRLCRIDELPQLVNVLRGEMSLVGPRPERPYFTAQLARALPSYDERTKVLPGVTGWAQVRCPYAASIEDTRVKLEHDLHYVANRSSDVRSAYSRGDGSGGAVRHRRPLNLPREHRFRAFVVGCNPSSSLSTRISTVTVGQSLRCGAAVLRSDGGTVLSSAKVFAEDITLAVLDPGCGRTKLVLRRRRTGRPGRVPRRRPHRDGWSRRLARLL